MDGETSGMAPFGETETLVRRWPEVEELMLGVKMTEDDEMTAPGSVQAEARRIRAADGRRWLRALVRPSSVTSGAYICWRESVRACPRSEEMRRGGAVKKN